MKSMLKKIVNKLEEFGTSFKYQGDSAKIGVHTFICDYFILVYRENEERLYISFNASTIPTRAAADILIFKQIRKLDIEIAEPYFHKLSEDGRVEFITGGKALDAFIESIGEEAVGRFIEEQKQLQLLYAVEGYPC